MTIRLKQTAITGLTLVFLVTALAYIPPAMADDSNPQNGYRVKNQAAVKKLYQMSKAEIDALDVLISEALTHYYDRKYKAALSIFQDIAEKVETMDIMFWIGTSAARTGRLALAKEQYEKMLKIDPSLDRVRLELATVYFAMGDNTSARKEMETVKAGNPPPQVLISIKTLDAAIEGSPRNYTWNANLSTGWMSDDNISTGPDAGVYTLPGGSTFTPTPGSVKTHDNGFLAIFTGNYLYDSGDKQDFMWNTGASVYSKTYQEHSQFNYLSVNLHTGPWWVDRKSILKVPFNYTNTHYGSDRLSYIMGVNPSYTYFFSPLLSLGGAYTYKNERFFDKTVSADLDNSSHTIELTPTLYFQNRSHILTCSVGYEHNTAKADNFSYDATYIGLSYLIRFPTLTELYLAYQWTQRDYPKTQPFPYAGQMRLDKRNAYTVTLSQPFFKHFYTAYTFSYTDNQSNLELYTWEKTTHTISVGYKF